MPPVGPRKRNGLGEHPMVSVTFKMVQRSLLGLGLENQLQQTLKVIHQTLFVLSFSECVFNTNYTQWLHDIYSVFDKGLPLLSLNNPQARESIGPKEAAAIFTHPRLTIIHNAHVKQSPVMARPRCGCACAQLRTQDDPQIRFIEKVTIAKSSMMMTAILYSEHNTFLSL